MPRPITKNQMRDFWYDEYASTGHCVLCGNHGFIDTRGKVFTPAGHQCGDKVFCICPNGRTIKRKLTPEQRVEFLSRNNARQGPLS